MMSQLLCVAAALSLSLVGAQQMSIDKDRMFKEIEVLGEIGAYEDEQTGVMGVRRLGLTPEDGEARRHLVQLFEQAGLEVTVDAIGNILGRREGLEPGLAPVMSGSHIDSVATAGRFDGPLGVLGALEVVRTMNDFNITTRRSIVIASYTDEEGRFGGLVGSAVLTGLTDLADAYAQEDRDGAVLLNELQKIGFVGPVRAPLIPHAHIELHIEQGPILGRENFDIGVVTGIPAIWGFEVRVEATGGHAGATPIEYRSDAGLAAAHINLKLREMASSGRYGTDMRVTMGIIETVDASENVIPSNVRTSIDLRNPIEDEQARVMDDIQAYANLVVDRDVTIEWNQRFALQSALMTETLMTSIEESAQTRGYSNRRLPSGAGHDSQNFAEVTETAMIFVPGQNGGISHNPLEYSSPEQCEKGVNVLLDVLLELANS